MLREMKLAACSNSYVVHSVQMPLVPDRRVTEKYPASSPGKYTENRMVNPSYYKGL